MILGGDRPQPTVPTRTITRRQVIAGSGIVAVAGTAGAVAVIRQRRTTPPALPPPVADPVPVDAAIADLDYPAGVESLHRYVSLVGGGDGVIYGVQADGELMWFRHEAWADGGPAWANGGTGRRIGGRWHRYETVLAGADGHLYGIQGDGVVRWHRWLLSNAATGEGRWAPGSGAEIATGMDRYPRIFGGYDGVIYGVDGDSDLHAHTYTPGEVPGRLSEGTLIARDFKKYQHLVADAGGVIFGVSFGSLQWWRHLGDGKWANNGQPVALPAPGRFDEYLRKALFPAAPGVLYGVAPDGGYAANAGRLHWYRLTNPAEVRSPQWAPGVGRQVGTGFSVERTGALMGYPTTPSVRAGEAARFAVSSTYKTFDAAVVRLSPGDESVVVPGRRVPGQRHPLRPDHVRDGCDWPESVTIDTGADWQSGLYALRITGPDGLRRHVPFTVRPAAPRAPLAFLVPTNTYAAYNGWGGHDQYCVDLPARTRTFSFHRPSVLGETKPTGVLSHTLYSDLLLTRWMTRQGYAYDCYTDADLDQGADWLNHYRALVLGSHPEYWSDRMRSHLTTYLAAGGRLIYPGGNGIYERVAFTPKGDGLVFRKGDGGRDIYVKMGRPPSEIYGANYHDNGWMTMAPYKVLRDHPLLRGTGLTVGSLFGERGYNGPASGQEYDSLQGHAGEPPAGAVIARGTNLPNHGATMLMLDKPNGGFVFSASSINFVGALDHDPAMSALFRNVFTRALEPNPGFTPPQR